MTSIKRSALIGYSQQQMFELVNQIEAYPHFLPWCSASRVLCRTTEEVVAELDITWSGMNKKFTTRNRLTPYSEMSIFLEEGPFQQFQGLWQFVALGSEGCRVNLDLEFELANGLINKLFQPIFNGIANSLVDAFCQRAVEVYGQPAIDHG